MSTGNLVEIRGATNVGTMVKLEAKKNKLSSEKRRLFEDIFSVSSSEGELEIPPTFMAKVRKYFGSKDEDGRITESEEEVVKRIRTQRVIRTYNKWTGEGSLFNPIRASRPGMRSEEEIIEKGKVYEHIKKTTENCDFCDPEKYTSKDVFDEVGRVVGKHKHCISGANVAKYDAWSGMIYFKRHNPLKFNPEELSDYIETGFEWFEKVNQYNKEFRYPFFVWNCLEKAGASQVHGHAQVLIGKGMHYAKVEVLRRIAQRYKEEQGRNYFKDLYAVHDSVDLALSKKGVRILAYLTPIKEKEIMIITSAIPSKSNNVKHAIFKTLRCYIDELGVTSFNLTISMPPFGDSGEFPYIVRIVDRGSIFKLTTDMGGMELYGSSVIATDPYTVVEALKRSFSIRDEKSPR